MKDLFDVQQLTQFEFGAIIITVLVAGLVFGCLIAYGLLKRKDAPKVAAATAIQEEFEEYKDKVDDHFNQTSEMFRDVTTQYKKLYDHMAVGAIELSKADAVTMPRLEMQEPESTQEEVYETVIEEEIIEEKSVEAEVADEMTPENTDQISDIEDTIIEDSGIEDDDNEQTVEPTEKTNDKTSS